MRQSDYTFRGYPLSFIAERTHPFGSKFLPGASPYRTLRGQICAIPQRAGAFAWQQERNEKPVLVAGLQVSPDQLRHSINLRSRLVRHQLDWCSRGYLTHVYRMTGSARDAENHVQETYLSYQASVGQEIVSLKAYLSTINTCLALDYLKSAHVARERYVGTWLPEPIITSEDFRFSLADLEQEEALSQVFLRLLEVFSPPECAVFLLHEIFEYSFSEIAGLLEKSQANCHQTLHRAKQALQDKDTRFEAEPQRQHQFLLWFLSASHTV